MILSRVRILPQQRYDLEDFYAQQSAGRTDSKLWTKQFISDTNAIVKGFVVSGVGFNQATVVVADSTLIIPESTSDQSWFTVAPGSSNIIIPDSALVDGSRNYVELKLVTDTGTPIVKSFWDPSANGGQGAEFNQLIDTMFDLDAQVEVSTGGFSGSPDRLQLAIIDVDNSGVIKIILDRRKLLNRLGNPSDIDEGYTWSSQTEPTYSMSLTGVVGTFTPGELLQIGSVTAQLVSGTTSPLVFSCPDGISFAYGSVVTGLSSGGSGTVNTIYESFSGADKDLDNQSEVNRAVMTEIRALKGTRFWYESAGSSIIGNSDSILFSRFLFVGSEDNLEWSGTDLSFSEDITLRRLNPSTNVTTVHTIAASNSPVALANGQYLYVMLSKTATTETVTLYNSGVAPLSSQDLITKEAVILFRRMDNSISSSRELYLPFNKQFVTEGQVFRLGASGAGGSGGFKVTGYDPVNTILPTGSSVSVDGVTLVNGDLILYTNLSVNNNRVYKVSGIGTSISWTPVRAFENGAYDPADGDRVIIKSGTIFADQTAIWDGSDFTINDVVKYFNGTDYWQVESIKKTTLLDNQVSPDDVFSIIATGTENMVIDFSLIRDTTKEVGSLYLTHDGTNVSIARVGTNIGGDNGIIFEADISGADLRLRYTSTSMGVGADFKFIIKRWSDGAGGPAGVPSYITSGGSPITAAGSNSQIQFNNGGLLGADGTFTWNNASKTLKIGSTEIQGVNSTVTLNDNQGSPLTFLSLDASVYKHAVVEYSASINGNFRTGRILVVSDGSMASGSDDFIETNPLGLSLQSAFSGGFINLQYTTGMTGVTGEIKFNIRKWI